MINTPPNTLACQSFVALALLCATGCGSGDDARIDAAQSEDASALHHDASDAAADAGTDAKATDVGSGDARDAAEPLPDAATAECALLEVHLVDGTRFWGELIASYDHRFWWWNSADRTTLAFFREPRFDGYPDDRSLHVVALSEVEEMERAEPDGRRCYREFRHARGLTVERSPLDGVSTILMGNSGYHRYEGGMGDFAWDFTRVDSGGSRYQNDGRAVEDYWVWDEPVYAPVSGYVVEVVRDAADNEPGDYPDDAVNNMVGIHLGGAYYLYLLHFRQGSIPADIVPDTWVDTGDLLGRVGNSGVTLEPHLHITLLWHDAAAEVARSWSVPTDFTSLELAPTPRGPFEAHEHVVPLTGQSVRPAR